MASAFARYQGVWEAKPLLRRIYADFHDRIARRLVAGPTLEIGGGIGQFKHRYADVIASDIQHFPGLDVVADAQALPFADRSLGNIVMIDALHHIEFPKLFLQDADRVLTPGGRIVMVEPAITWGSTLFYRFLHQEPVRMAADPLALGERSADRDPYDFEPGDPDAAVYARSRAPDRRTAVAGGRPCRVVLVRRLSPFRRLQVLVPHPRRRRPLRTPA